MGTQLKDRFDYAVVYALALLSTAATMAAGRVRRAEDGQAFTEAMMWIGGMAVIIAAAFFVLKPMFAGMLTHVVTNSNNVQLTPAPVVATPIS